MINPAPCEFRRVVDLDAPVAEVYAFHADPRNVSKISPAWQSVRILEATTDAREGQTFEIEVRILGLLPIRWRGIWHEVRFPNLLVDDALKSVFAFWRHRHVFEELADRRTRMTDHVSYQFPGGWLGKCFGETLGRIQFHYMFADRQARTQRWIRENYGVS